MMKRTPLGLLGLYQPSWKTKKKGYGMKKYLVVEIENAEEFEKLYNDYLKKASELREVVQKLKEFYFSGIVKCESEIFTRQKEE